MLQWLLSFCVDKAAIHRVDWKIVELFALGGIFPRKVRLQYYHLPDVLHKKRNHVCIFIIRKSKIEPFTFLAIFWNEITTILTPSTSEGGE